MDIKRFLRGPIIWIVLVVIGLVVAFQILTAGGFHSITTEQGLTLLKGDSVTKVVTHDPDQFVDSQAAARDVFGGGGAQAAGPLGAAVLRDVGRPAGRV